MEKVTVDTILEYLKENIESKQPVHPSVWLDAAEKLNVLREDEDDKLIGLLQKVAQKKVEFIEAGDSVAMAKVKVEASNEYRDMLKQQKRCERILEFIRIEKIRANLKDSTFSTQPR